MALGRTQIAVVREKTANIRKICNTDLMDCWNTFQYIAKNMDKWADETIIGKDVRDDMLTIAQGIKAKINYTNDFANKLDQFADRQEALNK